MELVFGGADWAIAGEVQSGDGTTIRWTEHGVDASPLLLVHGGLGTVAVFRHVIPYLRATHRCICVGRRGYGLSDLGPGHSYDLEAADIAAVARAIGRPVALFGHSSGAIAALEAAARGGFDLRALAIYEPPLKTAETAAALDGPWRAAAEDAVAQQRLEDAALIGLRDAVGYSGEQLDRIRSDTAWAARAALSGTWVREMRSTATQPMGVERFSSIAVPCLLIEGSETAHHHVLANRALGDVLSDVRVAMLEGYGHEGLLTAPQQVARALLGFLAGIGG